MSRKLKKRIKRVGVGASIYLAAVIFSRFAPYFYIGALQIHTALFVFLAAYIIIGGDVVKNAVRNIGHGQIFDENFLDYRQEVYQAPVGSGERRGYRGRQGLGRRYEEEAYPAYNERDFIGEA